MRFAFVPREPIGTMMNYGSSLAGSLQEVAWNPLFPPLGELWCGLCVEDVECLLQAFDLRLSPRLTLLIRLRLCNAALLDLTVVLHDGAEFRVCRIAISRKLADCLVQ